MSEKEKAAAWEFKLAVQGRPCVVCKQMWRPMEAHHGVEKQYLQRHHPGTEWDVRNAVPVCPHWTRPGCHGDHTSAMRRIPRSALPESVEEFATEVLGAYGDDYLRRMYETEQAA